jgi:hypothetical protein
MLELAQPREEIIDYEAEFRNNHHLFTHWYGILPGDYQRAIITPLFALSKRDEKTFGSYDFDGIAEVHKLFLDVNQTMDELGISIEEIEESQNEKLKLSGSELDKWIRDINEKTIEVYKNLREKGYSKEDLGWQEIKSKELSLQTNK